MTFLINYPNICNSYYFYNHTKDNFVIQYHNVYYSTVLRYHNAIFVTIIAAAIQTITIIKTLFLFTAVMSVT